MKRHLAILLMLVASVAQSQTFYCSSLESTKKVDRFDILQAYSGQPVLVGNTWLAACMYEADHPETKAAFINLIGVNPASAVAMARSSSLVDRGIRITRNMESCLIANAPAVGYSTMQLGSGGGIKPCF
jgi:hypothetical protein